MQTDVQHPHTWKTAEHLSLLRRPCSSLLFPYPSLSFLMSSNRASLHPWPCYLLEHLKQTVTAGGLGGRVLLFSIVTLSPSLFFWAIIWTRGSEQDDLSGCRVVWRPPNRRVSVLQEDKSGHWATEGTLAKIKDAPVLICMLFLCCCLVFTRTIINSDEKTKGQRENRRLHLY